MFTYLVIIFDSGPPFVHSMGDLLERLEETESELVLKYLTSITYSRTMQERKSRYMYEIMNIIGNHEERDSLRDNNYLCGLIDSPLEINEFADMVNERPREIINQWKFITNKGLCTDDMRVFSIIMASLISRDMLDQISESILSVIR